MRDVVNVVLSKKGGFRTRQRMGFKPQRAGSRKRIYSGISPPRSFVTAAMDLTVVRATERHRELVTDLATERTRLREAQMVWIGGPATAYQARLLNHVPDMIAVTNTTRFGEDKHTLVYLSRGAGWLGQILLGKHILALCNLCLDNH
jgi:hypothetical protein